MIEGLCPGQTISTQEVYGGNMGTATLSSTGAFRITYSKADQGYTLVEAASEAFGFNPSGAVRTSRLLGFLIHSFEARAEQNTNYHLFVF
jgi:hypothetical protein